MRAGITLILLLTFSLVQAENVGTGLTSALFRFGLAYPTETYNPSFGFNLGVIPLTPASNLKLGADITYWKVKYDYYQRKDNPNDDIKLRNVGANFSFYFYPLGMEGREFDIYFGGGLAINYYTTDYPDGWPEKDKSKTNLEPHLDFGFEYPITRELKANIHTRYTLSDTDTFLLLFGAIFTIGK